MTPERWKRARELFDAAVGRSPEEAEEYLRAQCAGDVELFSEVRHMLDERDRTGRWTVQFGISRRHQRRPRRSSFPVNLSRDVTASSST